MRFAVASQLQIIVFTFLLLSLLFFSLDHKVKPGTNIYKALTAVYEMMISQEADERRRGLNPPPVSNSTRHVIILLTDGEENKHTHENLIFWQLLFNI